MQTTLDIVQGLSDSEIVEVVKELFNTVYTEVPYNEVRNNSEAVAEVDPLVSLDTEALKHELSATESARLGRLVLEQYARDPELAPFVQQAWDKVQNSDNLVVGMILAVGLVVNLTLLVATTEVEVQKGADGTITWRVVKKEATPELIDAVVKPVVQAVMAAIA